MVGGEGGFAVGGSLGLVEKVLDGGDFLLFLVHLDSLRDAGAAEVLAGAIGGEMRLNAIA